MASLTVLQAKSFRLRVGLGRFVQQLSLDEQWTFSVGRAIVSAGILENGFFLWEASNEAASISSGDRE